jgi:predicted Rossmann fold flavoprotein
MSGGGRCNFTNLHCSPQRFLSANPHFCKSALSRYTQWDFIELVRKHRIDYFEKETVNGLSGQLFCRESSKQIVAMLLQECREAGVEIRTQCETQAVKAGTEISNRTEVRPDRTDFPLQAPSETSSPEAESGFTLVTDQGQFQSETLVVATGGLSIPSLGGSGFGYSLAEQFGLELLPRSAGLVPLTFTDATLNLCQELAGVSCEVVLSNSRATFREDLLFTHRGLSGPAALQLSSYWQPGESIEIDLLPGREAGALLLGLKHEHRRSLLRTKLAKTLPQKLVEQLQSAWWPKLAETPLAEWPNQELERVATTLNHWTVKPAATEGYRTAEVTLGGVDTRQLSSKTMESKVQGLFFIGEVVDVTGHLGGFNFQWAWSSGYAAGQAV